jgi:hypothetical protein
LYAETFELAVELWILTKWMCGLLDGVPLPLPKPAIIVKLKGVSRSRQLRFGYCTRDIIILII